MYSSVRDRPASDTPTVAPPPPGPPPRVHRNVWFLGLTSLFTDISSEMVNAVLPLYLTFQLGFTPLQFGLFDGAYQGMTGLLRIAGGLVADRRKRYKEVAGAGYGLSAACKIGLLASSAWAPTTGVLFLDRAAKGIRTAPRDALISLNSAAGRLGESFGVHRALDTFGALLGPVLAFALLGFVPGAYDAIFVASFCIALIGLGVLVFFVSNRPAGRGGEARTSGSATPTKASTRPGPSSRESLRLLGVPRFRRLATVAVLLSLLTVSDAFIYLSFQRRAGMATSSFPLLFVGTALVYLILAVPLGRLADRVGRAPVFLAGHVALAAAYLALGTTGPGWVGLALLLGLLGTFYAATDGVLMALASTIVPEEQRTSGLALLTTFTSSAKFAASIAFGLLWTWRGTDFAVSCFFVGLALALPVAAALLARHRTVPPILEEVS